MSAAVEALVEKKAKNVVLLDMRGLVSYTDYFIIAEGESAMQARAMAEEVISALKKEGFPVFQVEGLDSAGWVLLDCGEMIVHIFLPELRAFYALENFWSEAPREEISETFE